jgi:tetratricopeptide (TPR) repeat protein
MRRDFVVGAVAASLAIAAVPGTSSPIQPVLGEKERTVNPPDPVDSNLDRHGAAIDALADLLRSQGNLDGAIATYQQSLRLKPGNVAIQARLSQTRRMRELLRRLPAVLAGKEAPKAPVDACGFAQLCAQPFQQRYAAAARLYEQAFAADAKRASDLTAAHRYNGACCAALAGTGQGKDAAGLDDAQRAYWRQQALDWLGADLARHADLAKKADGRPAVRPQVSHWLKDADLAGVRDEPGLTRLPEKEREAWRKLWADVAAFLKKGEQK